MLKAQQLQVTIQQYVLASSETERQKVIQNQIPGSQPHYFLSILQEIKKAQFEKSPLAPNVKKMIQDYNHHFRANYSQQFEIQEFLLQFSELKTDKERKAYFTKLNDNYMHFKSSWQVQPPQVKKLAGSDMKQRSSSMLSNKLSKDKIPTVEQLVKKMHGDKSNFSSCSLVRKHVYDIFQFQTFFPFIDFHKLPQIQTFISQRSRYIPHLESNKTFIPALAAYLDKQCHRNKNNRYDADRNLLEPLTIQQLDKLGESAPFLPQHDKNFIGIRFSKMFHGYLDSDKQEFLSLEEQRQNLKVMYDASKKLPITLRSKILIQILKNGIALNDYSFDYFIDFLKYPTIGGVFKNFYQNSNHWDQFLSNVQKTNHSKAQHADSSQSYRSSLGDQQIAKKYITHFFTQEIEAQKAGKKVETGYFNKFKEYMDEKFLRLVQNETRLKAGLPLPEGEKLDHNLHQRIQNQVLLRICEHNKALFLPQDDVQLFLEIKNVKKLYIKVFEINTENYYKKYMAPFKTDVNLDGLVSTYERTQEYNQPPSRQFVKSFKFQQLKGRIGLFVFEFIGNGISSRAIVKKGSLSLIHKATSMGHQAYVLDEHRNICKGQGVSIFIQNEEYVADEETGRVIIPYSKSQVHTKAILKSKSLCQLADFMRISEEYQLKCTSLILPESIIMGAKANILLLPHLLCNGRSASLAIIKKCSAALQINSTISSIPSTQQFNDLKLQNGKELTLEFTVPPNLASVNIRLNCQVFNLTRKSRDTLSFAQTLTINSHYHDFQLYQLYMKKQNNSYNIYALGKNGQPKQGNVMNVVLMMQKFSEGHQNINVQLATDKDGKIELGPLVGIKSLIATGSPISAHGNISKTWQIPDNKSGIKYPQVIDCIQNQTVNLPFLFNQITRDNAILLRYDSTFNKVLENKSTHLKVAHKESNNYNGIQISGLKYGYYSLRLPDTETQIHINVHSGKYWGDGFILTFDRILENKQKPSFLKIRDVEQSKEDKNQVTITVQDGINDGSARVHAFAFQYLPQNLNMYAESLRKIVSQSYNQEHFPFAMWKNFFLSNRQMGDEFRYVFDRKNQKRFVGNTLDKPKMLIKRNFLKDTTFAEESLQSGTQYATMQQKMQFQARGLSYAPPPPAGAAPYQMMQQNMVPMSMNNNNNDFGLMTQNAIPQAQFFAQQQDLLSYKDIDTSMMNCVPQYESRNALFGNNYGSKAPISYTSGTPIINGFQNFLAHSLACGSNLKPNPAGKVSFSCDLDNYSGLFIIALDHSSVTHHFVELSKQKQVETRRLDLLKPLKSESAYAELRKVTNLKKHDSFIVDDLTSSKLQFVDSLQKIAQFLEPLVNESSSRKSFQDFGLLKWPVMSENEKQVKLNKYFSHQFNLFIWAKDRQFFDKNIRPMISYKCEKTLVDYFLLNDKDELKKFLSPSALSSLQPLEKCLLISTFAKDYKESSMNLALTLLGYGQKCKPNIQERNKKFDAVLSIGELIEPSGVQSMIREEANDLLMMEEAKMYEQEDVGFQAAMLQQIGGAFNSGSQMQMSMRNRVQEGTYARSMRNARSSNMNNLKMKKKVPSKLAERTAVPAQYQQLEEAKQYAETHYYGIKQINHYSNRSRHSLFWGDLAIHLAKNSKSDGSFTKDFLTQNFVLAANTFTQLISVLTFLDLPFKSPEHGFKTNSQRGAEIKAADKLMIYAKDLKEIKKDIQNNLIVTLRISEGCQATAQSKDSSKVDQLLVNQVYTAQVVVTNVSPIQQQAQLLFQIPECSIPLEKTPYHKALPVKLQPYHNFRHKFTYYFPKEGEFTQAPISLSVNGEKVIAQSKPLKFKVVSELSFTNAQTFRQIIATGDMGLILKFLKEKDLIGAEMGFSVRDIYYFLKNDEKFWRSAIGIYRDRQLYDRFMWSLGFYYNDVQTVCELLSSEKNFKSRIGSFFRSQLINVDPNERNFRLLDYHPLVNKRAHRIGGSSLNVGGSKNRILNREFSQFYNSFIVTIAQKPFPLDVYDRLNLIYFLLLQDRVDEALEQFKMVDQEEATKAAQVQYDYMRAYLDFYMGSNNNYAVARKIADKYEGFPVISWRLMFDDVRTQIKELDGEQIEVKEPGDEEQFVQERRKAAHQRGVAAEPQLVVSLESKKLSLDYLNIGQVEIKYYPVDLELLFSREPFLTVQTGSTPSADQDFSYVKPALTEKVQLSEDKRNYTHEIAKPMIGQNMIIEVVSGKKKELKTYFATSLMKVMVIESYGEIKVNQGKNGKPLPKVYVKVFSKKKNSGAVSFHKDGYTDIRGRFDYASISGGKGLKDVEKFAILVMSDDLGSLTKEAKPPSGMGKREEKI